MSTDGAKTFTKRGAAGQDFMGSIWIDPANPDVAIAPSMQQGAVKTVDGGRTWSPLGSAMGSMAVAVDPSGTNLVAIGMDGAQQSSDGGATWTVGAGWPALFDGLSTPVIADDIIVAGAGDPTGAAWLAR